jgi:hypothetical protein
MTWPFAKGPRYAVGLDSTVDLLMALAREQGAKQVKRTTPLRIQAAMRHFNCSTPAELAQKSDAELLEFPNFGRTSLRQLRAMTKGGGEAMKLSAANLAAITERIEQLAHDAGALADEVGDIHAAHREDSVIDEVHNHLLGVCISLDQASRLLAGEDSE